MTRVAPAAGLRQHCFPVLSCPLDADGERVGSMGQQGPRICGVYSSCIAQIVQHECIHQQMFKDLSIRVRRTC